MTYFNEFDPFAAAWLRELGREGLIDEGEVDERSIKDVAATDVVRYRRCHFFAGIGGWDLALRLAGWPADRPVWTGSCPCQPYSSAGKGEGDADPRNLWPELFRLIRECRPECVFGEQVESAIRHGWLDRVCADLEGEGYAVGACVLGAHGVGAPHIRQRLFWVATRTSGVGLADADRAAGGSLATGISDDQRQAAKRDKGATRIGERGDPRRLAHGDRERLPRGPEPDGGAIKPGEPAPRRPDVVRCGPDGRLGDAGGTGLPDAESEELRGAGRRGEGGAVAEPSGSFWADSVPVYCRDGKYRRVPLEPGLFPLAHGVSGRVAVVRPGQQSEAANPEEVRYANRVGALRGAGNAIVPEVAAEFIKAFLESEWR